MRKIILLGLVLAVLLLGCSAPYEKMSEQLKQGMGKMTYEQAVQNWGEPVTIVEKGNDIMVHWIMPREAGLLAEEIHATFDKPSNHLRSYKIESGPSK